MKPLEAYYEEAKKAEEKEILESILAKNERSQLQRKMNSVLEYGKAIDTLRKAYKRDRYHVLIEWEKMKVNGSWKAGEEETEEEYNDYMWLRSTAKEIEGIDIDIDLY